MPRRRDYRAYWFGICRCFFCALWYNGTTFQRWAVLTQLLLMILIPVSVFLPWIQISYKTGNHLERMRPTFAFIDGNGNNKLEFDELSHFFKDMQQVFWGGYFRNDAEMVRAVLIDRSSPCLSAALLELQGACGIGDRAVCLQADNWILEGGDLLNNPVKAQECIVTLMDQAYVQRTGDNCVNAAIKDDWLNSKSVSSAAKCARRTSISIEDFSLYGRHMVQALPAAERSVANHCINASFTTLLSVYGVMHLYLQVQYSADMAEPRCHSILKPLKDRKMELGDCQGGSCKFLCITSIDYWSGNGYDLGNAIDPLKPPQPPQCRKLAAWIDQVLEFQALDFGCNVTCSPSGRAQLSAGCVPTASVSARLNRKINSPFRPSCTTRIGTGIMGDDCPRYATCPSCSLPTNTTTSAVDVTPTHKVHAGTSGMSAVLDTMCVVQQSIYIRQLTTLVRAEKARDARALEQAASFKAKLVAQCKSKIAKGDFADGVLVVSESAASLSAFPDSNPGRQRDTFECKCRVNVQCEQCVTACVDAKFFLPTSRTGYTSSIACQRTDLNRLNRLEGSAAFPPRNASDPYALPPPADNGPYNRTAPARWQCVCEKGVWVCGGRALREWPCDKSARPATPGAINKRYPFAGSVAEYASPLPVLGVWQLFLVLCPVGLAIVCLFGGAAALQLYNLVAIWWVIRASDDLNNADSWNNEVRVLRGLVLTALVIFVPASLYGAYITAWGDTIQWGAVHRLQVGWGLSIVTAVAALVPFYGAWKSFKARPVEWRNAVAGFRVVTSDMTLASVVPGDSTTAELAVEGQPGGPLPPHKMRVAFADTIKPSAQEPMVS